MSDEKLTETIGVRVGQTTATEVAYVAKALGWSDAQVLRWCLEQSLGSLRDLASSLS